MFIGLPTFSIISSLYFKNQTPETLYESFKNWGGVEENVKENFDTLRNEIVLLEDENKKINLTFDNSSILSNDSPILGIIYQDENTIKYKIKSGDTFEKIANYFGISPQEIKNQNNIKKLKVGNWITIKLTQSSQNNTTKEFIADKNLPYFKNYFSLPTSGWNWGELHYYNAVDISNKCGSSVYAAADGIVINDSKLGDGSSGWNDGYGIFVLLEHQNGTKTRYAHLSKSLVKIGDNVKKGQIIGLMGNSGNSHGPSGCHLHFEVYGAKNPFVITR